MGNAFTNKSFYWVYTDQPHLGRRKEILAKYPQIKKLMGHDWRVAIPCLLMVAIQLFMINYIKDFSWKYLIVCAYVIGGTINHSLSIALHEIGHNLAFGNHRLLANRILGLVSNLPIGVPASITFKKYHIDHHRYLNVDQMDPDLPTDFEVKLFSSRIGKIIFIFLQPFTYSLRPVLVQPKPIHLQEVINLIVQLAFDLAVYYFFGFKSLAYLLLGTMLGLGLHPISGHFIAEHYVFIKGIETYSYYGPLNFLTFNVGYHNEHHDFPNVPCYKLPEVKRIAPEYYDNLPHHTSWLKVIYDFVMCDEMGPNARNKRKFEYTKEYEVLHKKEEKDEKRQMLLTNNKNDETELKYRKNGHAANGHANGYANGHANGIANGCQNDVHVNGNLKHED